MPTYRSIESKRRNVHILRIPERENEENDMAPTAKAKTVGIKTYLREIKGNIIRAVGKISNYVKRIRK